MHFKTNKKQITGIGVMTGTSMDGMDLAVVRFAEAGKSWNWKLLKTATLPLSRSYREQVRKAWSGSARDFAAADVALGHFFGKAIQQFIQHEKIKADFAAVHGQTIFHQPAAGLTAQIGDGETIAAYLPFPVVSNFRTQDVALGGEGAPLVPFGEKHLFPGISHFLNLGGIANLSSGAQAFDVSPCNLALNHLAGKLNKRFDKNGKLAASGKVNESLLRSLNRLKYYRRQGPKSLGAEWVQNEFLPLLNAAENVSVQDLLCTTTEHIAQQVANALQQCKAKGKMLVTGGGARNTFLMERIRFYASQSGVEAALPAQEAVIDFKEALIFAFLGLMRLQGRPNTLAAVTGARRAVSAGTVSWGNSNHRDK